MTLTSVRALGRHLTRENHESILARARGRSRHEIEALVAELAPRPDTPSAVRKVPTYPPRGFSLGAPAQIAMAVSAEPVDDPPWARASVPVGSVPTLTAPAFVPRPRPVVQATAPERYRVQFTIGTETLEKLRKLQALLRRQIPDGDPGKIFDRALTVLLEKVEKAKLGATTKPRSNPHIRPGTDKGAQKPARSSRYIPRAVRRAVWRRDSGQCAFVSATGQRCPERTFLEFHHVQAYARHGPATVTNISLRCSRHNRHEAEIVFGSHWFRSSYAGDDRVGANRVVDDDVPRGDGKPGPDAPSKASRRPSIERAATARPPPSVR